MAIIRICSVPDCGKTAVTKGLCPAHYFRLRMHGDPLGRAVRIIRKCSLAGCDNKHHAKGFCTSHFLRNKRHGDPLGGAPNTFGAPAEFFDTVVLKHQGDDCLTWPFSGNGVGYGKVFYNGHRVYAHRLACELVNGPAPSPKHQAAHSCGNGNKGCVNPRHLAWKTHQENMDDKYLHGTVAQGERNGHAKLTANDVRAIRARKGKSFQHEIAADYGVSRIVIQNILSGKRWSSVR